MLSRGDHLCVLWLGERDARKCKRPRQVLLVTPHGTNQGSSKGWPAVLGCGETRGTLSCSPPGRHEVLPNELFTIRAWRRLPWPEQPDGALGRHGQSLSAWQQTPMPSPGQKVRRRSWLWHCGNPRCMCWGCGDAGASVVGQGGLLGCPRVMGSDVFETPSDRFCCHQGMGCDVT